MSLTRVTITGADDKTDQLVLRELSTEFPFVEWAILRSTTREGTARYPSVTWRRELASVAGAVSDPPMQLAAHFCGQLTRDTLAGNPVWFHALPFEYDRVQLNGFRTTRQVEELVGRFDVEWILQCRDEPMIADAAELANALPQNDACRISALWDCSGGRGIETTFWPVPPKGLRLGYAGGISQNNVVSLLESARTMPHDFWIDMESGVRTDDCLDLAKVRRVLELTSPFVSVSPAGK